MITIMPTRTIGPTRPSGCGDKRLKPRREHCSLIRSPKQVASRLHPATRSWGDLYEYLGRLDEAICLYNSALPLFQWLTARSPWASVHWIRLRQTQAAVRGRVAVSRQSWRSEDRNKTLQRLGTGDRFSHSERGRTSKRASTDSGSNRRSASSCRRDVEMPTHWPRPSCRTIRPIHFMMLNSDLPIKCKSRSFILSFGLPIDQSVAHSILRRQQPILATSTARAVTGRLAA